MLPPVARAGYTWPTTFVLQVGAVVDGRFVDYSVGFLRSFVTLEGALATGFVGCWLGEAFVDLFASMAVVGGLLLVAIMNSRPFSI